MAIDFLVSSSSLSSIALFSSCHHSIIIFLFTSRLCIASCFGSDSSSRHEIPSLILGKNPRALREEDPSHVIQVKKRVKYPRFVKFAKALR